MCQLVKFQPEITSCIRRLTVEAHVLGEALSDEELVLFLDEISHGRGVLVQVARAEALVGDVKEREELLGLSIS